jgi:glycosyltransferase involved in cell wall biosynthesis
LTLRVLTIADRDFANREHDLLQRVESGLHDTGAVMARAIPQGVNNWDGSMVEAVIGYDDMSGMFVGERAPGAILNALRGGDVGEAGVFKGASPVDVVHAWGHDCFRSAAEIALASGAALVLDISSEDAVGELRAVRARLKRGKGEGSPRVCLLACDDALYARAKERGGGAEVRLVPWGVPVEWDRTVGEAAGPVTVSVMCTGRSRADVVSALDGIAEARGALGEVLVFLDEQALDRTASLQRHIEDLGLEDCLSVIGNMESARQLILETDLLIAPDLGLEHRSLVLEALGYGMGVIVHEGCFLRETEDEPSFDVVSRHEPAQLANAILGYFRVAGVREERAGRARGYVKTYHDVRTHIRRLRDAYGAVTESPSVPIRDS